MESWRGAVLLLGGRWLVAGGEWRGGVGGARDLFVWLATGDGKRVASGVQRGLAGGARVAGWAVPPLGPPRLAGACPGPFIHFDGKGVLAGSPCETNAGSRFQ